MQENPPPPGRWFVLNTLRGHEQKAKRALETRITRLGLSERIFEVRLPLDEGLEMRDGRKQKVAKKRYPGYLFVRCLLDEEIWTAIRHTPGISGFAGVSEPGRLPAAMSDRDAESMLSAPPTQEKHPHGLSYHPGEQVRVTVGPFTDFLGTISEVFPEKLRLRLVLNIFGRETPTELGFDEVRRP